MVGGGEEQYKNNNMDNKCQGSYVQSQFMQTVMHAHIHILNEKQKSYTKIASKMRVFVL